MIKLLTYGELLGRLHVRDHLAMSQAEAFTLYVGGAEANVAVALAQLGHTASIISAVPKNNLGERVIRTLRGYGLDTRLVTPYGEKLGLYYTDEGSGFKSSEVIYDRLGSSFSFFIPEMREVQSTVASAQWFHWTGITPAVSQNAFDSLRSILQQVNPAKTLVSADLNYRSKLWKWGKDAHEVTPELVELSQVLITTEEALEKMLGLTIDVAPEEITPAYYEQLMQRLFDEYTHLKYIFMPVRRTISAGHNRIGLFGMAASDRKMAAAPIVEITEMVDRIGAGDAMTAGIIHGISKKWPLADTVAFGVAASAYKHAIPGDFLVANEKDLLAVAGGNKAKISR